MILESGLDLSSSGDVSWERGNELSGSIRGGQSVDQLRDYKLLSNTEICFQ